MAEAFDLGNLVEWVSKDRAGGYQIILQRGGPRSQCQNSHQRVPIKVKAVQEKEPLPWPRVIAQVPALTKARSKSSKDVLTSWIQLENRVDRLEILAERQEPYRRLRFILLCFTLPWIWQNDGRGLKGVVKKEFKDHEDKL